MLNGLKELLRVFHINKNSDTIHVQKPIVFDSTVNIPVGVNVGIPAADVDNRFVALVAMKATAYTIANAAPADGLCHSVIITHATVDTTDTLGDAVITGTNYINEIITETITIGADAVTEGVKAFKTITGVITPDWVQGGATADNIKVGHGGKIGLPVVLAAASYLVMATHGTAIINSPTVAYGVTHELNHIDLASACDGAKELRVFYKS